MSTELEDRLRRHYGQVADQLELPERTFQELLSGPDRQRVSAASGGRRGLMVAAAVVLVVGAVGLIATRRSDGQAPVASQPAPVVSPRPFAEVDELSPTDWVTATVLPDGVEWLYANRRDYGERGDNRAVAYGQRVSDGTGEQLWIEIGARPAPLTSSAFDVDGTEWQLDGLSGGWWSATRQVGDTTVNVRAQGDVDAALLAGLAVVDESELPYVPLGGFDEATEVAQTALGAVVFTYAVQESNGFYCHWVSDGEGRSGGCGGLIEPDIVVTIDGGSTEQLDGADTITAVRTGTVSVDAARVEVDFADGTTLTVTPTDLSGRFNRQFWIAAATISTDSQIGIAAIDEAVGEVRAYNTNNDLLGIARPAWVPDPTIDAVDQTTPAPTTQTTPGQQAATPTTPDDQAGRDDFVERVGDDLRAAYESGQYTSPIEPTLTPAIDINAPGEYRVPVELPPGTDTRELSFIGPSDDTIQLGPIDFQNRFVDANGQATIVLTVVAVETPHPSFQLWIQ